jgi:DNA (cytosine-5)-methyltransferase 1
MKAIDLFCGVGGLTRGLSDAGIEVVAGIDIDPGAGRTYEFNNPSAAFLCRDIRKVRSQELLDLLDGTPPSEVLLAGCAPCRSFSQQRRGCIRGHDATLLGAFGRFVKELVPGWILVENVPGLTEVPGFSTFRRFLATLRSLNYSVAQGVLNARDYGVPQHRRRFVLIASHKGRATLPEPCCGVGDRQYATVREWIAHFPPIKAGEEHRSVPNHFASPLTERNLRRLQATPHDGGDRRSWPKEMELRCHAGKNREYTDVYGRLWWDRQAPTLTGRCYSISNGRYGHPEQDRAISLREAASLQTFPDSYLFFGFRSHIAQHVGNAVPVLLAETLGATILQSAKGAGSRCALPVRQYGYRQS